MKTIYVTDDGKEFKTKKEAFRHEKLLGTVKRFVKRGPMPETEQEVVELVMHALREFDV